MNENAQRIIEEQTLKLLNSGAIILKNDKDVLDNLIKDIETVYTTPINENKDGRDAQYVNYRELISSYGKTLGEIKYNLLLKKEEYLFLKDFILKKLEYDRQTLFVGILVRDSFFYKNDTEKAVNRTSLFNSEDGIEAFSMDINEITRLSHLTGFYTVQGLDNKADLYANIVKKIGDISKIFEIYNLRGTELSERGGDWIQGFQRYENDDENTTDLTIAEVSDIQN